MLTAQLTEIRRDLAQFPSAALQRACTAVDDARTLPWPRQLQLRRRLMLACGTKCGELEPEACSLELECIAPGNSTRRDHRQDQAALTVLAWKHHLQGTCTRQFVSLIVHVEGVKVPCAAA